MGVPAFYRWLSEKYPKIVEDVLEERVQVAQGITLPFDATRPNPSGLETDNLYVDMNGIIHPCSHPEHGPQPTTEVEMYENVCRYIDRLVRAVRPRRLLYLAIDGVAPRAKMNQQRSRRFRAAQEAREKAELEAQIRSNMNMAQASAAACTSSKPWDSNVITPGTEFMINLATHVRFYIRKRLAQDPAWQALAQGVIFSDASIPGEGEHKIMTHIRHQRASPGYNPNLVHTLHGLDADLIMLALATHEAKFYILREEVLFGRRGAEAAERRRAETGFSENQQQLDLQAGTDAMNHHENQHKPLQRVSIPILREYLAMEFHSLQHTLAPGKWQLERIVDDVVFLCFFVGNDFLPHLPSLDIRDGALDFLFNVYKRLLPSLGDYLTNHGGKVNLEKVDIILAEVGAIEDHVFAMKHQNEVQRERDQKNRKKRINTSGAAAAGETPQENGDKPLRGRAARILAKSKEGEVTALGHKQRGGGIKYGNEKIAKKEKEEEEKEKLKARQEENARAAEELKRSLNCDSKPSQKLDEKTDDDEEQEWNDDTTGSSKRKVEEITPSEDGKKEIPEENGAPQSDEALEVQAATVKEEQVEMKRAEPEQEEEETTEVEEVEVDEEEEEEEEEEDQETVDANQKLFKEKVKEAQQKQLDDYAKNVEDKVRLHEAGWKDRYYTDKCKADDVSANGGREHLFRSYIMGLCWVMKYYYDGCPSWKWYYPFHYAPFASDLRNVERFARDCNSFELNEPFRPVEQLMAVLPEDSKHAIPKASRWLMADPESPIIDFYPKEVPVDPNGKAMPWLWVVLLPFIEEDRLTAAMHPTMSKWTKKELLCNTRGLDDGYLFVHASNFLGRKLRRVVEANKDEGAKKSNMNDLLTYGTSRLVGSVRQPLSHELHAVDATIEPPQGSSTLVLQSTLFAEPIENSESFCVSFSEPRKLPHKSILLPGAVPPAPVLASEDHRIRRPRFNRGATIANMGGNNRSHEVGHGSMNISSYERELAERTGRGGQMYQAGTRAWGAMEPTPKRPRHGGAQHPAHPPYPSNPFQQMNSYQNRPTNPPQAPADQYGRRVHQNSGYTPPPPPQPLQPPQQRYPPHQNQGYGPGRSGFNPPHRYQQQGRQQQQYHHQQQPHYSHAPPSHGQQYAHPRGGHPPGRSGQPPPPQRQQGYDFRQQFQSQQQPRQHPHARHPQNPPPRQQGQRVNPNLMSSLRSQLANTLRQNRRTGDRR